MVSLSVCFIVKNEAQTLKRALDSIKDIADEIIVVDTGSTDQTKLIAKTYTTHIFDFEWSDDFSKARNFSLSKATKDWVLVLDADELIEQAQQLKETIQKTAVAAFYLEQRSYTNDVTKQGFKVAVNHTFKGYVKSAIVRLFQNHKNIYFTGVVQETVDESLFEMNLKPEQLPVIIHHYPQEQVEEKQEYYLHLAEKELAKKPSGRLFFVAATIYLSYRKDAVKALEYYQKASKLHYKIDECLLGIAECHLQLKNYQKAYDSYKKLLDKGLVTPGMYHNIATLLLQFKHYEQALKFFQLALKTGNPNIARIKRYINFIESKL